MKPVLFSTLLSLICSFTFAQQVYEIPLSITEMEFRESDQLLYYTEYDDALSGFALRYLNPQTRQVEGTLLTEDSPKVLALSPDGNYLYIGLDNKNAIVRHNFSHDSIDMEIDLGANFSSGILLFAEDIVVNPDDSEHIFVALKNKTNSGIHEGIRQYVSGQEQGSLFAEYPGTGYLFFAGSNPRLYGMDLTYNNDFVKEYSFNANGLTQTTRVDYPFYTTPFSTITSKDNRLFSQEGAVFDLSNGYLDGGTMIHGEGEMISVAPGTDTTKVFAVEYNYELQALTLATFAPDFGDYFLESFFAFDNWTYDEFSNRIPVADLRPWGAGGKFLFRSAQALYIFNPCTSLYTDPIMVDPSHYTACFESDVTIEGPAGLPNYYWSTGDTTQNANVSISGTYTLRVADSLGCLSNPSNPVTVEIAEMMWQPNVYSNSGYDICLGDTMTLEVSGELMNSQFVWSTGDTSAYLEITQGGEYKVYEISENGCVGPESSIFINQSNVSRPAAPTITAPNGTKICGNSTVLLTTDALGYSIYEWTYQTTNSNTFNTMYDGEHFLRVGEEYNCLSEMSNIIFVEYGNAPPIPTIVQNGNVLASSASSGNQWYFNGNAIAGATNQFYSASESGFYYVVVTTDGCSSQSELFSMTVSSTWEENAGLIELSPNPVQSTLFLSIDKGSAIDEVSVHSISGKKMLSQSIDGFEAQLEVGHLPKGTYILLGKENSSAIYRTRFVVN